MRRYGELNGFQTEIELKNGSGSVRIGNMEFSVKVERSGDDYLIHVDNEQYRVRIIDDYVAFVNGRFISYTYIERPPIKRVDGTKERTLSVDYKDYIIAPIAGRVNEVLVKKGRKVSVGDTVVILESMKMLIEVKSEREGVVKEVLVKRGDVVNKGQPLVKLAEDEK